MFEIFKLDIRKNNVNIFFTFCSYRLPKYQGLIYFQKCISFYSKVWYKFTSDERDMILKSKYTLKLSFKENTLTFVCVR